MSSQRIYKSFRMVVLAALLLVATVGVNTARAQEISEKGDEPAGKLTRVDMNLSAAAARVGGEIPKVRIPRLVTEVLVFDSFANAVNYTATTSTPNTFMGYPFNTTNPGVPLQVSKITVYLAFNGTTATTYNALRVNIQLWNDWTGTANPVFSNAAAGGPFFADITGPLTLNPNTYIPIDITFSSPIALTDISNNGYVVNFQGDTGSGFASSTLLTSLLRFGPNPIAIGSSPLVGAYGYRNVAGQTTFNFDSNHSRSFGQTNEATVFRIYAVVPDPTATPTATATNTLAVTATNTATITPDPTATNTPTITPDPTATNTATITPDPTATNTATNTPIPALPDTIGVYNAGQWYLRNSNTTGPADITAAFGGDVADLPVVGDWDGNGVDTIGVYRNSTGFFYLSDSNTSPAVNYTVLFGNPGDTPFAGKWDNTMTGSGIGVYRNSNGILYEKKTLTTGFDDFFAIFGNPGDIGFAGDWEGNGFDSIGVYRSSNTTWFLSNNSTPSGITFSDIDFVLDIAAALPVVGDWDGDLDSTPGWLTAAGVVYQHPNNSIVGPDNVFAYGPAGSKPVAGKWTGGLGRPPVGGIVSGSGGYVNPNDVDKAD
jgi:hypothetical protein